MWFRKRSSTLARAGWRDDFLRPNENPPKQPWRPWGNEIAAQLISNRLRVQESSFSAWGPQGGWGYEFQPLTNEWGFEFEIQIDPDGVSLGDYYWLAYIDENWTANKSTANSKVKGLRYGRRMLEDNASYDLAIMAQDTSDVINGPSYPAVYDITGQIFNRQKIRVRISRDRVWIVYLNDKVVLNYTMMNSDYWMVPGGRGINLKARSRFFDLFYWWAYDYQNPWPLWSTEIVYDDFNRANGAVGNGWTSFGSAGQIVNNSYSTTGTTDGSRAILRDTGVSTGRMRVEATIGGNIGPNSAADSSLLVCANAAGTQGLSLNVFSGRMFLSRFSSSLTSPTFTDFSHTEQGNVTVASGDKVALSVYGGEMWMEKWMGTYWQLVAMANNVHAVVPATNSYAGLRVERAPFNNSNSWNDVRILTA